MSSKTRRPNSIRDIATFWGLVVVASVIMAALAFAAGKYWVGGLIAHGTPTAPQVEVKTPEQTVVPKAEGEEGMTEPPPKAVVKMEQRQPTDAERGEIEQKHPQDGAGLHGATGADTPDTSTGSDSKPLDGSDSSGLYSVKAGSYVDPDNAQRHSDELTAKGYSTEVVTVEVKGKTYHRVMVGPYMDQAEAERVRDELSAAGYEASVKTR